MSAVLIFETLTGNLLGKFDSLQEADEFHDKWSEEFTQTNIPYCTFADLNSLQPAMRQLRQNIRNFLIAATRNELEGELQISKERKDVWRAAFVQELILEL